MRDGAMSSAALLRFGMRDEVKRFIGWYAGYQFENGMIPCVVDRRGPDPVPENDSHGEFIYACMEYFRFTKDTTFLRQEWPHIVGAVDYIQALRSQRMTKEYEGGKRAFYGLVPESISNEGYSAKPMHSYWDDFFALKGVRDAAAAALALGERLKHEEYDSIAGAFQHDLDTSIVLSMKAHAIPYIPGCVELGDFDATSTSIALFPCNAQSWLPPSSLDSTFDKYYRWFMQRQKGEIPWDAFTPYEIRTVGTFVRLGEKERANMLLDWFLAFQRPEAWNGWAEVVWHNPDEAKFIGDMPHSWVGSDFINAFRSMFAYERDN
ncbi:MAG TPA: coagulation factor 5/8 type domain-containing protein, partial [Terriglobia bacterium]|nr:coagulation factor 5/8 type domain-containing protein [Terriglobia bacterium]